MQAHWLLLEPATVIEGCESKLYINTMLFTGKFTAMIGGEVRLFQVASRDSKPHQIPHQNVSDLDDIQDQIQALRRVVGRTLWDMKN